MKSILFSVIMIFCSGLSAQEATIDRSYEATFENPFGSVHPDHAEQLIDFAALIGDCDCKSINRNSDGTWNDTLDMVWRFKYIMNGTSIQDETWKSDGGHSGSIRQYITDSSAWAVTYFSSRFPSASPGVWMGGKDGEDIILYKDHTAPNGTAGDSWLTFYNIDESGFDWKGEWIDKTKTVVYPFWMIYCHRKE